METWVEDARASVARGCRAGARRQCEGSRIHPHGGWRVAGCRGSKPGVLGSLHQRARPSSGGGCKESCKEGGREGESGCQDRSQEGGEEGRKESSCGETGGSEKGGKSGSEQIARPSTSTKNKRPQADTTVTRTHTCTC